MSLLKRPLADSHPIGSLVWMTQTECVMEIVIVKSIRDSEFGISLTITECGVTRLTRPWPAEETYEALVSGDKL